MKKLLVFIFIMAMLTSGFVFAGGEGEETASSGPVRIFGVVRGDEAEMFRSILADFTAETGIEVEYEESSEFEVQIFVQAEAGTPPDIAGVPQPGVRDKLADGGHLVPLWPEILDKIDTNYPSAWKDLGTYKGTTYGVFHRVNVKSFVWYPKKEFESRGYTHPQTWDELIALSEQIKADGIAPWGIGMESGAATGWVGTDWMEDILLRTGGAKVYDQWISHEIPFNDPAIMEALQYARQIFFGDGYVYGGIESIPTTFFGDAVVPLFQNPPRAMLHRQGSFILNFMPEEVQANKDELVGVFPLPPIKPGTSAPLMGGGEMYIAFNDRPETRAVMEFLASWDSGKRWAAAGGSLFPYKNQDINVYPTEIERSLAKALVEAEEFRFDASDLMPAEVGSGTFWTGMVEWITGKDDKAVLDDIEKSWP